MTDAALCIRCGQRLTAQDLEHGLGECRDCRSPPPGAYGVVGLDNAIRCARRDLDAIEQWPAIRDYLRDRFGDNLSDPELWSRCTDRLARLASEGAIDAVYMAWPLDRLIDWLRAPNRPTSPTLASPPEPEGATPALSERKYLVLRALLELGATSADARRTTAEIADRAEGKAADPAQFKEPIADLKRDGLIDTREGRGGGCWLTVSGKRAAEKL